MPKSIRSQVFESLKYYLLLGIRGKFLIDCKKCDSVIMIYACVKNDSWRYSDNFEAIEID